MTRLVMTRLVMTRLAMAFVATLAACGGQPPPGPAPIPPTEACELAGQRLERLQCRDDLGQATWVSPAGRPYVDTCRRYEELGLYVGQDCLARLERCADLARARQTPRGEVCP